jgi:hypothetical protein
MRLPKALLSAVKDTASNEGIPYQRFIRLGEQEGPAPAVNARMQASIAPHAYDRSRLW